MPCAPPILRRRDRLESYYYYYYYRERERGRVQKGPLFITSFNNVPTSKSRAPPPPPRRHRTADVLSPPRELRSVQPFDSNLYTIIKIIIQQQYLYEAVEGRGTYTEHRNIVLI